MGKYKNWSYHEWEENRRLFEGLDNPERDEAGKLDEGENVHSLERHLAQEHVVRLVLKRHEHDEDAVKELQTLQWGDTHVEEHAEQHRHRDVAQHRRQRHWQTNHGKNHDVSRTLLPGKLSKKSTC